MQNCRPGNCDSLRAPGAFHLCSTTCSDDRSGSRSQSLSEIASWRKIITLRTVSVSAVASLCHLCLRTSGALAVLYTTMSIILLTLMRGYLQGHKIAKRSQQVFYYQCISITMRGFRRTFTSFSQVGDPSEARQEMSSFSSLLRRSSWTVELTAHHGLSHPLPGKPSPADLFSCCQPRGFH